MVRLSRSVTRNRPAVSLPSATAEIPPGPNAGRVWRDTPVARRDPVSGRTVTQFTNYRGHSHHLAGAQPCWIEGGRQLVIVSDREGCGNLFVHDFAAQTLTQLTDLRGPARPRWTRMLADSRLGFWYGLVFFELELATLRIARGSVPPKEVVHASSKVTLRTGEALLPDGRRAVWIGAGPRGARNRRVVAVTACSGRELFAATAPCIGPDTDRIVFASDADGYAQIYATEIGRSATLPRLVDVARQ